MHLQFISDKDDETIIFNKGQLNTSHCIHKLSYLVNRLVSRLCEEHLKTQ